MDDRDLWKAAIAEFLGPFALVVAGVGAVISTQNLGDGGNLVAVALAHGLAIALMAAALGAISGGHFNPAVSVAMLATGNVAPVRAGVYIVSQLLGAVAGAGLLTLVFPALGEIGRNNVGVNLGVPGLGPDVTVVGGVVFEAVMTFFLVLVIFGTAVDARGPKAIAPLMIGLTITMDIIFGGRITGAAMNPARAFGPELVQQDFTNWWIYWIGPIAGGLIAAFLYSILWLKPAGPAVAAPAARASVAASTSPQPQPQPL
ncbi:MAG: MIP family channel protein, partial [Thermomicrobiales bacterium]